MHSEAEYSAMAANYADSMRYNHHLLSQVADLRIENAKLKKELDLYKAFSIDVTDELVARAMKG